MNKDIFSKLNLLISNIPLHQDKFNSSLLMFIHSELNMNFSDLERELYVILNID